jgi:hypothetical protein
VCSVCLQKLNFICYELGEMGEEMRKVFAWGRGLREDVKVADH